MSASFQGIDHLGVAVADLDSATDTYGRVLGFPISGGEVLAERGVTVRFVETGDARIELLAPLRDDSEISRFLAKRGEGLHHVCIRVDDIEAAVAHMEQQGARMAGKIGPGAGGSRVAFVHPKSAHGVLIELVEQPEESTP